MKGIIDKVLTNPLIDLGARWLLGLVFLYACFHKILDPSAFAKIIYGYQLLPGFLINVTAIILPFVELFAGVCLIVGILPRPAAIIINGMLAVFIIAISINLARGHAFDCGCFSIHEAGYISSNVELLIRDLVYFLIGLVPVFFHGERKGLVPFRGR